MRLGVLFYIYIFTLLKQKRDFPLANPLVNFKNWLRKSDFLTDLFPFNYIS